MDQAAITAYIAETCPGTDVVLGAEDIAPGDTFFIYAETFERLKPLLREAYEIAVARVNRRKA